MSSYLWPNDEGWPYPDTDNDLVDPDNGFDDDALALRTTSPRLLERLSPLERTVVTAHYGLAGTPPRTMKQLRHELGMPRAELRHVLAGGLAKLRTDLACS